MFKRRPTSLTDLLGQYLREQGLETPLLQQRLVEAWPQVVGPTVDRYVEGKFIRNQTLFVKMSNPALKADLMMMQTQLVRRLNEAVGSFVIAEIKYY